MTFYTKTPTQHYSAPKHPHQSPEQVQQERNSLEYH